MKGNEAKKAKRNERSKAKETNRNKKIILKQK
jgi:hypothetical protein